MDELPYVDYEDFFEQLHENRLDLPCEPSIPFETSRGCWWGERMHCTYCSLNGENMAYRSKSTARTLDELTHLARKWPGRAIQLVDNILGMDYFGGLIPKIAHRQLGARLFCETKSNLTREQVRALAGAGFTRIQPGIESLSTPILKLMRKGATALQNIQLLKWCKEFGIGATWNLLLGFPREPQDEYARMADGVPSLTHLQPPVGIGPPTLHRFCPYHEAPERFGLTGIAPSPAYRYVYPLPPESVARLAGYFIYDYRAPQNVARYTKSLSQQVRSWRRSHGESELLSFEQDGRLAIWDERPIADARLTILSGVRKAVYVACDSARTAAELQGILASPRGAGPVREEIESVLDDLTARRLMLRDGNRYLSLAVPIGVYRPGRETIDRIEDHLRKIHERRRHEVLMAQVCLTELPRHTMIGAEELARALAGNILWKNSTP